MARASAVLSRQSAVRIWFARLTQPIFIVSGPPNPFDAPSTLSFTEPAKRPSHFCLAVRRTTDVRLGEATEVRKSEQHSRLPFQASIKGPWAATENDDDHVQ